MELTLNAPALLFPTISLLMLAYTNRFLAIASLIRNLHKQYNEEPDPKLLEQIKNLRLRLRLIQNMQALGVLCLFFCVLCMFTIYTSHIFLATIFFGIALILLMSSLVFSIVEINISTRALRIELSDIEEKIEVNLFRKVKAGFRRDETE